MSLAGLIILLAIWTYLGIGYYFASTTLNYIENSKDFIGQAVNRTKHERPGTYILMVFLLVITWLPAIIGQIFHIFFNKNVRAELYKELNKEEDSKDNTDNTEK